MTKRKAGTSKKRGAEPPRAKTGKDRILAKLTEAEEDLLRHMEDGYQLETDSVGGNPVLRDLKSDEVIRPLSANRSTVEAMEERGLIAPGKGDGPLKIAWRLRKEKK
jgi:hypothetical protein